MILLGLGFTTRRLSKRLLLRGESVYGVSRDPTRHADLRGLGMKTCGFDSSALPRNSLIVHTIPPLEGDERVRLHDFIRRLEPSRVLYISATSVYGDQAIVDENTAAQPSGEKSIARFEEEQWLRANTWKNLAIRPAAIYGPGRGVQERILEGKLPRGSNAGVVSRIHVDDLAAVLEAGIYSNLEGAWPLADEHPCASEEVAGFCARLLNLALRDKDAPTFPVAGRHVDGRKIMELLGLPLLYPTYESGILASLAEHRYRLTTVVS